MSNERRQSDNLTPFTFNSTRATPKESRPRATYSDRPRSPQRDRYSSSKHDRNEGEHPEFERSGYDSYKPGQSPSRDMIPAPKRTSSISSPQINSTFNDSRRSSSVRSPSESSPYGQPDRPANLRTNTASSEQSLRPQEVGIGILGRAAKADEERKQREEEAKLYKAKAARHKAASAGQVTSNMERTQAHVGAADATEAGLSWKDKANTTEGVLPRESALSDKEATLTMSQQLLANLIGDTTIEMCKVTSVMSRAEKCRANLDRAVVEFNKSKDHHERFPDIKDRTTLAKKLAEKEYRKASDEVELKKASLRQQALHASEKAIPSIVGDINKSVEKKFESTVQKFEAMFREQKAYYEGQLLKANQQFEKHQNSCKEEFQIRQAEVDKQKLRIDKLFARHNEFVVTTQNLSKELGLVTEAIAGLSTGVPKDLTLQLQKLSGLDQLRSDVKDCASRSTATEAGLTTLSATVSSLTSSVDTLARETSKARDSVAETLIAEQNKLRGVISEIADKVKGLEGRIFTLEKTAHEKDQDDSRQQLKALEVKLEEFCSRPSNDAEIQDIKTELSEHTAKFEEMTKSWDDYQRAGAINMKQNPLDITPLEDRLTAVEQKQIAGTSDASFESRIAALERERRHQGPLAVTGNSSITRAEFDDLSNQVSQSSKAMDSLETELADLTDSTGDIINALVNNSAQAITERLSNVESTLQLLNNTHASIQSSVKTLEDSHLSIKSSVKDLQETRKDIDEQIRAQNETISDAKNGMVSAAAASLDEKFMYAINQINAKFSDHVEAQSLATGNLQYRMDNLNTAELHRAIVDSVGQAFPNLRNVDMTIQNLNSQMSTMGINVKATQTQVAELQESRQAHASVISPAPATRQDDAVQKAMRTEVDGHTLEIHKLKKDFAAISASLAKTDGELAEEIARRYFELQSTDEEHGGKLDSLGDKVRELEKKVNDVTQKQQQQQPSRTTAVMPRTAFASSRQTSASMSTHRQPSISSDTSSVLRKRKAEQINGAGGASAGIARKAANGVKHGSESVRGSPVQKRSRRSKIEDDPEMDPDYEEEGDSHPGISVDEDEDE